MRSLCFPAHSRDCRDDRQNGNHRRNWRPKIPISNFFKIFPLHFLPAPAECATTETGLPAATARTVANARTGRPTAGERGRAAAAIVASKLLWCELLVQSNREDETRGWLERLWRREVDEIV